MSVVGIQACLRAASEQKYGFDSISVIGGGHSANCIGKDALVVDMSCWKKVEVYPKDKVEEQHVASSPGLQKRKDYWCLLEIGLELELG